MVNARDNPEPTLPLSVNRLRRYLARHCQLWRQQRLQRHFARLGAGREVGTLGLDGTAPYLDIAGKIELGDRVTFRCITRRTSISVSSGAILKIGADSYINQGANFAVTCNVTLGRRCVVAEEVSFFDSNHHEVDQGAGVFSSPVFIGKNVWIGHGAIILPGTRIGNHSVVGAGAVVRGEFPARSLLVGVPARRVREVRCADDFSRE